MMGTMKTGVSIPLIPFGPPVRCSGLLIIVSLTISPMPIVTMQR